MTNKEKSFKTKKKLSKTLKKLMEIHPLDKITIVDIVRESKVNRKTFYYYFNGIPELLKWTLEQEALDIVKNIDLLFNFEDALNFIIDYSNTNKFIFKCALETFGREQLRDLLATDFSDIVRNAVDNCETELNLTVSDDFKSYYTDFYTDAVACRLIEYFKGNPSYSRKNVVKYLKIMLEESMPILLKKASELN